MDPFKRPQYDTRDAVTRARREQQRDALPGYRIGDYLRFADGSMRRIAAHWGDSVQPNSCVGNSGSYYLGEDGWVSFSGGLLHSIPVTRLRAVEGEVLSGVVWFFHHEEPGAFRGVWCEINCRVFEVLT